MLHIECSRDYQKRWPIAESFGLFVSPDRITGRPLRLNNRTGLKELSFVFFVGWLFTSILNRSKVKVRLSLLPAGPRGESSVLVLYPPETHLASPSRTKNELFDREYFVCPLDRSGGIALSETQRHLCPVVNKLRYNLAHARPDGDVAGLKEPHRTAYCCDSKKRLLWEYLGETLFKEPELYGPMVGGRAFPIDLPFEFLEKYLTGVEPGRMDLGKLMEETFLWFAMATSEVIMGFPHVSPKLPIVFHEIDVLLYEAAGNFTPQSTTPADGWERYFQRHSVCLMEFTVGHQAEVAKSDGTGELMRSGGVLGKDVPKNKLMNFHAFKSFGFRSTQAYYLTVTGEASLGAPTLRALNTVPGFNYFCLSDALKENIEELVLNHNDVPVPAAKVREWHEQMIIRVESGGSEFRKSL
jgi:hypothetical protein